MTRAEAIRTLVLELSQTKDVDEVAAILGIPVPHPERTRAPILEPLGGPAVVTSQAAASGGKSTDPTAPKGPKRVKAAKPPPKPVEPKKPDGRRAKEPIECGTHQGRGKHKRAGEPICDPCRLAYNAWQRGQYDLHRDRPKTQLKPIDHGTRAGYVQHRRRNEDACSECRAANTENSRQARGRAS